MKKKVNSFYYLPLRWPSGVDWSGRSGDLGTPPAPVALRWSAEW
jgi:hypothetical protein